MIQRCIRLGIIKPISKRRVEELKKQKERQKRLELIRLLELEKKRLKLLFPHRKFNLTRKKKIINNPFIKRLFIKNLLPYSIKRLNKCFFFYFNFFNYISCLKLNYKQEITIYLKDKDFIKEIISFLKKNNFFFCNQLLDFTAIDKLELQYKKKRFEFLYVILSTYFGYRIYIRGFIGMFECLSSFVFLYKSLNWLEREVWDMFGIFFIGHPDLRRILSDYGFLGYPLRKDFPITGYVEVRYDDILKYIVVEPIELSQEFRFFRFDNPWKCN